MKLKPLHSKKFAKIYGLAIYHYMKSECLKHGYVKQEKIFNEYLLIPITWTNRRQFRHYRNWLEELYIEGVIEYCFDDNKNGFKGLVLSDGHKLAKQIEKEAKKMLKRASRLRKAADDRFQGRLDFYE